MIMRLPLKSIVEAIALLYSYRSERAIIEGKMTLSSRTLVLHTTLAISLLLLLSSGGAAYLLLSGERVPSLLDAIEGESSWFGLSLLMSPERVIYSMVAAFLAPTFALFGLVVVERFFRRTLSPQVFFFAVFLLGLSFEGGRVIQALLHTEGLGYALLGMVTRFVAFGRIMAMSALVAASLYAAGISYQKNGVVLAIIVAISGGVSYASPVNSLTLAPDLLFRIGEGYSVDVVHLLLGLVAVINYLQAALTEERGEYLAHAVAIFAVVGGWFLLVEVPMVPGISGGAALLVAGSTVFLRRRYTSYLWS
ncbi:MAG: hypothetical protein ACLFP6_10655 [Spirochaetaceae bacterium]